VDRAGIIGCGVAIVILCVAAYWNSFHASFLLDDKLGIVDNPTIRSLVSRRVLTPPAGTTVQGRPLANLSLAVNYKLAGQGGSTAGYHLANLAIHILAALVLMGVVRRTLLLPRLRASLGAAATPLAGTIAALWALHPLQTQAVTCVLGRTESMMGLCYLLVFYCTLRWWFSPSSRGWMAGAFVACAAGMAAKEAMVTAPILLAIFERMFVAPSWRELLRRRWRFYAPLFGTWLILAPLVWQAGTRGGTAWAVKLSLPGQPDKFLMPWQYFYSELGVVLHYLSLAFWPSGLCLDYGWPIATTAAQILPSLVLGVMAAATVVAVIRRWPAGFLGAWFFLILTPSSSFLPLKDLAFEHRMYLPLAAVISAVVICLFMLGRRALVRSKTESLKMKAGIGPGVIPGFSSKLSAFSFFAVLAAAVVLAALTHDRNNAYASELSIWRDTVEKRPLDGKAHTLLALAYMDSGEADKALDQLNQAIFYDPGQPIAYAACGNIYAERFFRRGYAADGLAAMHCFTDAITLKPDYFQAYTNRGRVYGLLQNPKLAKADFDKAIQLQPDYLPAYRYRAYLRMEKTVAEFDQAWEDYRYCKNKCNGSEPPWLKDLRAALEKATGRTE
jgi:tetratricopeptide (TPR) repeat protein